jgi:hypothetical protein
MSGGSLDYAHQRLDDIIAAVERRAKTPLHRAFAKHLDKVSKALHDLEWIYSDNYGDGDEVAAIKACISPSALLDETIRAAEQAVVDLQAAIAEAKKGDTNG